MRFGFKAAVTAIGVFLPTAASAATPAGLTTFIRDHQLTRYDVALADLNDDGQPEAVVYAKADAEGGGKSDLCGSGGCNLYVLALTSTDYRRIADVSITCPPIRFLPTKSHGWHDIGVFAAGGGGIPGYEARLRFDGHGYPSNPSVPPVTRWRGGAGKVLIKADPPVAFLPTTKRVAPSR